MPENDEIIEDPDVEEEDPFAFDHDDAPNDEGGGDDGEQNRGKATFEFAFEGGVIRYFDKYSRFEATCGNPLHKPCRLTREAHGNPDKLGQGRPLGLMASWLEKGHNPCITTHDEHRDPIIMMCIDFDARLAARRRLKKVPGSACLFEAERKHYEFEDFEEPKEQP